MIIDLNEHPILWFCLFVCFNYFISLKDTSFKAEPCLSNLEIGKELTTMLKEMPPVVAYWPGSH